MYILFLIKTHSKKNSIKCIFLPVLINKVTAEAGRKRAVVQRKRQYKMASKFIAIIRGLSMQDVL